MNNLNRYLNNPKLRSRLSVQMTFMELKGTLYIESLADKWRIEAEAATLEDVLQALDDMLAEMDAS